VSKAALELLLLGTGATTRLSLTQSKGGIPMGYCHEVMLYIVENEPIPSTKLAEHFQWSDLAKRHQITALRAWGWITPSGYVESTEKGRAAISGIHLWSVIEA